LLVVLDDRLGSSDRVARVFTCVASCSALAEEVPALVERDLDRPKPLELDVRQRRAGVGPLEGVLLVGQLTDASDDLQIVYATTLSAGSLSGCSAQGAISSSEMRSSASTKR
jgi:hypothetical protein